jgi:DNA replication protein DnaC
MIERRIISGLINSTEFCQQIKPIWNIALIESTSAKRIATWCWTYFDKYSEAPKQEIETIFFNKAKQLPKDIAEDIEENILPLLKETVNLKYLTEETEKYFSEQRLKLLTGSVQSLITAGEIHQAEKAVVEFKPLSTNIKKLNEFILTAEQIRQRNIEKPLLLMRPWLRAGQTTIVYGNYGSGKSLLTISIAYVLGLRDFDRNECDIGEWQVENSTGTLYIDGELGEQEMEERIKQFEWLGRQQHRMRILSIPEYQLKTEDSFYLSNRINQLKIIEWLKDNSNYKLLVLDSASTLFGLVEENDNSEWSNKINPFLRDLRALGVACLLLHHAGKDNKRGLRGASAMGAMAHNIFRLTDHEKKNIDNGEAWFVLSKNKQRAAGRSFKTFSLKYYQNEAQTETYWEETENY